MEIPEDGAPPQTILKTNGNFHHMEYIPNNKRMERSYYLGKAFRSLGESMHMISDMSMPAHVRNDSHPTGDLDPIEAYMQPLKYAYKDILIIAKNRNLIGMILEIKSSSRVLK